MTVSLGPFDKTVPNLPNNPRADGYGHNPRCLKRDVNKYAAAVTTANFSYALITQYPNINDFQNVLLGTPAKNDWGVHIGGHYTIGGDPGGVSLSNSIHMEINLLIFLMLGLLFFSWRSYLLYSPWNDRPALVDLADARSGNTHGRLAV